MSELLYPYGFVYETTCLRNNMKYRGSHRRSQDHHDPDDSWYLGSPTNPQFWEDLEDYGRDAFVRVILEDVYEQDKKLLKKRESYYLKQVDAMHNPMYYNRSNSAEYGGGSTSGMRIMHKEEVHRYFSVDSIDSALADGWELGFSETRALNNPMKNPEIAAKFSGDKNYFHSEEFQGWFAANNPMRSPESRQKVAQSKLGKVWINNGTEQFYVSREDIEKYSKLGYSLGMIKRGSKSDKSYDCICKICGDHYKGGRYSTVCKPCYSEMKRQELIQRYSKGDNDNA